MKLLIIYLNERWRRTTPVDSDLGYPLFNLRNASFLASLQRYQLGQIQQFQIISIHPTYFARHRFRFSLDCFELYQQFILHRPHFLELIFGPTDMGEQSGESIVVVVVGVVRIVIIIVVVIVVQKGGR